MWKIAKYEISLKCILKNEDWKVLVLKTPAWSSFNGLWDFPWWRIDENEFEVDYKDILKREIEEETSIKNVIIKNEVVAIWRHKVLAKDREDPSLWDNILLYLFFEWKVKSKEEIKLSEHDEFMWIKLEDIKLEDYFCSWYLEWAKMYLENKK